MKCANQQPPTHVDIFDGIMTDYNANCQLLHQATAGSQRALKKKYNHTEKNTYTTSTHFE